MKTPAQIALVLENAVKRRDEALLAQTQVQIELDTGRRQMVQLEDFAKESTQRWSARAATGVSATLLMHQRQFMDRLDQAIAFQKKVLVDLGELLERRRAECIQAERELASLNKYVERQRRAWLAAQERRDQKATDEMAMHVHLRQSQNRSRAP